MNFPRDDSYLGQELRNSSVLSKVNSFVSVLSKAYRPTSRFVFVNDKQCYFNKNCNEVNCYKSLCHCIFTHQGVESGPEWKQGGFLNELDNAKTHSGKQHPPPPSPGSQGYTRIFVFRAWHGQIIKYTIVFHQNLQLCIPRMCAVL